jgi:hypothetical protein
VALARFFAPGGVRIDAVLGDYLSRSFRAIKLYIVLSHDHRIRPSPLRNQP